MRSAPVIAKCSSCGGELTAHGARCLACEQARVRWVERTFTVHLDVGTYGGDPDDEEIAYLLRMGGIDARSGGDG